MIKAILFACLATVAFAEADAKADPWVTYAGVGGYGLGYGLGHYAGYGGYGLGYGGVHYLGKRSADAEPKADADPYYYGGYGLGYAHHGYGLGYGGYYGHRLGYAGYHGLGYYGKRSADAEPKADADPYYYGGYGLGYAHHGYGLGYGGYYGHRLGYAGYHGLGYYGKRSADAEPKADADPYYYGGYGLGYAHHGYGLGYGGYHGLGHRGYYLG